MVDERLLRDVLAEGRAAWPGVELTAEALAGRLARLPKGVDLERLARADFYLAAAASLGNRQAVAFVDGLLSRAVERCARSISDGASYANDVKSVLGARLFGAVGKGVDAYQGVGSLASWLRTAATRELLRHRQQRSSDAPFDLDALEQLPGDAGDLELRVLKEQFRPHFKAAFKGALAGLTPRERALLSLVYLDGVSFVELSRLYREHRITLTRKVAMAREALLRGTRQKLVELTGVPEAELRSLLQLVQTELSGSMRALLK